MSEVVGRWKALLLSCQSLHKVENTTRRKWISSACLFPKKGEANFIRSHLHPCQRTLAVKVWCLFVSEMSIQTAFKKKKRKKFSRCPEEYWLHEERFCVSLPVPTKHYHYLYHSHYCPMPDSFCHLRHWNNRRWLFEKPRSFSSSAPWLTNDFVKSNTVSCRIKKKGRNWILASVGHLICHLFNIDVHYVYGLFGRLLFSGPARPVWSVTRGHGPVDNATLIDGFNSLIVSSVFS